MHEVVIKMYTSIIQNVMQFDVNVYGKGSVIKNNFFLEGNFMGQGEICIVKSSHNFSISDIVRKKNSKENF